MHAAEPGDAGGVVTGPGNATNGGNERQDPALVGVVIAQMTAREHQVGPTVAATGEAGEAGFEEVFARERVAMVRLAYLMVGSEQVAEEVVQDAFVQVLERWVRVDNPGAYLRRCVVNGCIAQHRRRRLASRLPPPGAPSAELGADHTLDALRRLSAPRRAVVVLRYYADLTQDEIAEALGMKVGTVKSTLHRALAELREALGDE
jgi:RNA polymerase sigma-70 factor (sigma-E family)